MVSISAHGISDHGFYGKDGEFTTDTLPVVACKCGKAPMLHCEYDDTVGFKETFYQIGCADCAKKVGSSDMIDVLELWNTHAFRDHVHHWAITFGETDGVGIAREQCTVCNQVEFSLHCYRPSDFVPKVY